MSQSWLGRLIETWRSKSATFGSLDLATTNHTLVHWTTWYLTVSPLLLLSKVRSALLKKLCFLFQDVAYLLKETLLVMEDVILVLHKGKTEHEEDSRWAAQGLLAFFGAQQSLDQVVPCPRKVKVFLFLLPCHYKSTKQLTHSILMKFCFDGMKKLRRRFMNLVFFIVSSNLDGVKRFPSSISLITCLCDDVLYYYYLISLPVPLPEVLLLEDPTVS